MTPIKTSKGEFLVGKVPEGATNFDTPEQDTGAGVLQYRHNNRWNSEMLPPGYSYTFLFCTKEVTEQQAGEVVPIMRNNSGNSHYDYFFRKEWLFNLTRIESLRTLLLAHGLNPDDNFAFLRVNE